MLMDEVRERWYCPANRPGVSCHVGLLFILKTLNFMSVKSNDPIYSVGLFIFSFIILRATKFDLLTTI